MPRLIFAHAANEDVDSIADNIARDKPLAARDWLCKLRETCDTIAAHPNVGEVRDEFGVAGCRAFTFGQYVIFFRPVDDGIEVARVIHASRDIRNL